MFTSSLIQRAYQLSAKSAPAHNSDDPRPSLVDALLEHHKAKQSGGLLTPLNFYLAMLDENDISLIPYLSDEKKNTLLRNVQVTYLFLLAQTKYEQTHQKTENKQKYKQRCEQCEQFMDALQGNRSLLPTDSPINYLYLEAGQLFAQDILRFTDQTSITKDTIAYIRAVNEKRLYWVWTSSFLGLILDRFPDDFLHTMQAREMVSSPAPYTGVLSFGLYLFYFGLEVSLLLKHTFMPSKAEKEYTPHWSTRFLTQWDQRKFVILNYLFWGPGNLVCFFWLCGRSVAGTWGDVLTLGLLGVDIAMSAWIYEEQRVTHEKQKQDYENALKELQQQKDELLIAYAQAQQQLALLQMGQNAEQIANFELDHLKPIEDQLAEYDLQLEVLQKAKQQCIQEWHYANKSLTTDIIYAVGLMLSFALLAAPFFPGAVQTIASLTLVGGVLCFACSLIYNATKGREELEQLKAKINDVSTAYEKKCAEFNHPDVEDDKTKRLLFLEIKQLALELEQLNVENKKRTMHLIRSTLIESLVPAVALISIVFLPMGGAGIGVIAAAAFISVASYYLIEALFKEDKKELASYDTDEEYKKFCDHIKCAISLQPLAIDKKEDISNEDEEMPLLHEPRVKCKH